MSAAAIAGLRAPRIALLSGSIRDGSFNTKLVQAAEKVAQGLGAETSIVNLASYDLPLYNQDDEAKNGMPQAALDLKSELAGADGWIVSSPEYNGFPTPLLINAYTWCSRGDPDGAMYATFKAKTAVVMSASPGKYVFECACEQRADNNSLQSLLRMSEGGLGGMRTHNPHRQLLQNMGVNVLPQSVAVGAAFKAFADDNTLTDPKQKGQLDSAVQSLFYISRDEANRDATCKLIEKIKSVGEYGDVPLANQ